MRFGKRNSKSKKKRKTIYVNLINKNLVTFKTFAERLKECTNPNSSDDTFFTFLKINNLKSRHALIEVKNKTKPLRQ